MKPRKQLKVIHSQIIIIKNNKQHGKLGLLSKEIEVLLLFLGFTLLYKIRNAKKLIINLT